MREFNGERSVLFIDSAQIETSRDGIMESVQLLTTAVSFFVINGLPQHARSVKLVGDFPRLLSALFRKKTAREGGGIESPQKVCVWRLVCIEDVENEIIAAADNDAAYCIPPVGTCS